MTTKRFLLALVAVVVTYIPLYLHTTGPNDPWDTALFVLGFVIFTLLVSVMLAGTRAWDAKALGIFWVCVGLAILFARTLIVRQGWMSPTNEIMADAFRDTLIVGGILLLYSVSQWIVDRWRHRHA